MQLVIENPMILKGLKMENNTVFTLNDSTGEWETGSESTIPVLESLLKRLEKVKYADKNIKENVIFDQEYNIGIGSVKSFKDEDGDLVYQVNNGVKKQKIMKVDEDLDFGYFGDSQTTEFNKEKNGSINFWGSDADSKKPSTVEGVPGPTMQKINRKVVDFSSFSPFKLIKASSDEIEQNKVDELKIKSLVVPPINNPVKYYYAKREKGVNSNEKHLLFSMFEKMNDKSYISKDTLSKSHKLTYIRKNGYDSNSRKKGDMIESNMRYLKIHNIPTAAMKLFILNEKPITYIEGDSFDQFLKRQFVNY